MVTSRLSASARVNETGAGDASSPRPHLLSVAFVRRSMSLSVTSYRLAMTQGLQCQLIQHSVDARARDHVVVRRAVGLKVAEVAQRTRGAAPEQGDGAAIELADRRRAQVLLGAAVAEEPAPSAHPHRSVTHRNTSDEARPSRISTSSGARPMTPRQP